MQMLPYRARGLAEWFDEYGNYLNPAMDYGRFRAKIALSTAIITKMTTIIQSKLILNMQGIKTILM